MLTEGKKKVFYKAFTFAFAILFFSLLIAVVMFNWQKTDLDKGLIEITNEAQEVKLFTNFYDTLVVDTNSCDLMEKQMLGFADTVFDLGQLTNAYYQSNSGSSDAIDLQKQFTYMNLELWLRLVKYNKVCENKRNYLLYFYPYDCAECSPLVNKIVELKKEQKDNLWIFSIPAELDSKMVEVLENYYKIDYLPAVVINGTTLKGSNDFAKMKNYLEIDGNK